MSDDSRAHPDEYDLMFRVEERLWWYRGMERITRTLLDEALPGKSNAQILDAGCGTGGALRFLSDYGNVTGVDVSPRALAFCQRRARGRWLRSTVARLPFADASFDLVTSFDVLIMLDAGDAQRAASEFARVLCRAGRVLVRLPAYDWLRGRHDRQWAVQHRYTTRELRDLLERAGLTVEKLSYANMWLFPAAAVKRLSERVLPAQSASDSAFEMGRVNGLLARVLASEARPIARRGLPFGLSVVALARKPA